MSGFVRLAGVLFFTAWTASAVPIISIIPSVGPSEFSPNFVAYENNAVNAIENNLASAGAPGTPAYYVPATNPIPAGGLITTSDGTTSFQSWLGVTPGPYVGETGNAVYFGLYITSSTPFTLAQVSVDGSLGYNDLSGTSFGNGIVGKNGSTTYSSQQGANDDQIPITTLYTSGNFFFLEDTDPSQLANDLALVPGYGGTETVTLAGQGVPQSVTLDFVNNSTPEPSTLALFGLGGTALLCFRRRRVRRG
jgi:hypothetical protein